MFQALASLFFGVLPAIVQQIANAKVQLAQTQSEQEKAQLQAQIQALEARRDFLISNNRWAMYLIAVILAPFIPYLFWIILYDKIVCKWITAPEMIEHVCTTDPLSPWLMGIFGSILALLTLKRI